MDWDGELRIWAYSGWGLIDYCYKTDLWDKDPMDSTTHLFCPDLIMLNVSLGHWVQDIHPFFSCNIKRPCLKAQPSENAVCVCEWCPRWILHSVVDFTGKGSEPFACQIMARCRWSSCHEKRPDTSEPLQPWLLLSFQEDSTEAGPEPSSPDSFSSGPSLGASTAIAAESALTVTLN